VVERAPIRLNLRPNLPTAAAGYLLSGGYPNPFNASATVEFVLRAPHRPHSFV